MMNVQSSERNSAHRRCIFDQLGEDKYTRVRSFFTNVIMNRLVEKPANFRKFLTGKNYGPIYQ